MKGEKTDTVKVGFSLALERDRKIAKKTPLNIAPNIPGSRVRYKKRGLHFYYYLVKTYWWNGWAHEKVLRYYGTKPPRWAK